MANTSETIKRECQMMSHDLLCFILGSTHRKWRGYKAAVKAELAWRSGTARLG
jgi:hypothetical protein